MEASHAPNLGAESPDMADFEIPHDTGMPAILAGILIPHLVCTVIVSSRVFSRIFLLRKWFLDDTLIVAAWVFSTAICIIYSIAAYTPDILLAPDETVLQHDLEAEGKPPGSVHPYIMRTYLGLIFYQLCLCITKLSVLAFYLRMFASRRRHRRLAWATVIWVFLYGVPLLFVSVFQCHPRDGEFFGHPMRCFGFPPLLIASASLHTATDAWIIILVVPCVSRLDIPPRQKVALCLVLSMSIFVIVASLTRLQLSLHRHFRPGSVGIVNTLAFFVMTVLECDVALICASAPTLRPVLAKVWPKLMADPRRVSRQPLRDDDEESIDITSMASYHEDIAVRPRTPPPVGKNARVAEPSHDGWRTPTAGRSRDERRAGHKTPPHSIRDILNGVRVPYGRPRLYTEEEIRAVSRGDGMVDSRPVSLGLEEYFFGVVDNHPPSTPGGARRKKSSNKKGKGKETEKENQVLERRWDHSQDSFVLGANDPRASSMLSPAPAPVHDGETKTVPDEGVGNEREEKDPTEKTNSVLATGSEPGRPTTIDPTTARQKEDEKVQIEDFEKLAGTMDPNNDQTRG